MSACNTEFRNKLKIRSFARCEVFPYNVGANSSAKAAFIAKITIINSE
jgi:hypothetical protein